MSALSTEPPWLDALRTAAAARAAELDRPDDVEEIWRYSRVADIDFDRFTVVDAPSSQIEVIDDAAVLATVRDGFVVSVTGVIDGATVARAVDLDGGEALVGSVRETQADFVSELHDASAGDPLVIDIARGVLAEGLIVIDVYSDVDGGLTAPRVVVRAGAGSAVTVLERRRSGSADQLTLPVVEIEAGPDARVGYTVVQDLGRSTVGLERQAIRVDQQAYVSCGVAALGGSYARTRTNMRLVGRGSSGDLTAAYFGDEDQMLDFRTFQEHRAPDTTSNLLFKGAVTGSAQSVYSGLIRVGEDAPGTNAFQTNRNLKLSDDAWAYSVPNLEIEQNQVSCSHASTVGEIDDEQRFYLESRGVPTTVAEQLLVSGFFAEAIDKLPTPSVHAELRSRIDAALEADRRGGDAP